MSEWAVYDDKGFRVLAIAFEDPPSVLEEAADLISGDRQATYGHPSTDFACTAAMWSAWLTRKYGVPVELCAEDVGWLMTLLKVSRAAISPNHRDNLVDAAGYIGTVEMIQRAARVASDE